MIFILFYSGGPLFQRLVFSLIRSSSLLGWHHRLGPREADSEMSSTVPARLLGSALGIHPMEQRGRKQDWAEGEVGWL